MKPSIVQSEKKSNNLPKITLVIIAFLATLALIGILLFFILQFGLNALNSRSNLETRETVTSISPEAAEHLQSGVLKIQTANQLADSENLSAEDSIQIQGLISEALIDLKTATKLAPESVEVWHTQAIAYGLLIGVVENSEQFAIDSLNKAIELDPDNVALYDTLGGIYFRIGNFEKAIDAFEVVTLKSPNNSNGFYNLGKAYKGTGATEQASKAFQRAIDLLPVDHEDRYKSEMELLDL